MSIILGLHLLRIGPLTLLLCTLASGCGRDEPNGSNIGQNRRPGFIALVARSNTDPLRPLYQAVAKRYERTFESIPIRSVAADTATPQAQFELIEQLRGEGMVGLCVEPADDIESAANLEKLTRSGVVVVTLRRRLDAPNLTLHSGDDPEQIGSLLAEAAHQASSGRGTIGVTHADGNDSRSAVMHKAFSRRIQELGSSTVVLELDCRQNTDTSLQQINEGWVRFPRTTVWISLGNWPFMSPRTDRLLPEGCVWVTVDPDPRQWPRIVSGEIHTSIGTDYEKLLFRALGMCNRACRGEVQRAATYTVPGERVSSDNLSDWEARWKGWCAAPAASSQVSTTPNR